MKQSGVINRKTGFLSLLIICGFLSTSVSIANETIKWLSFDFPPLRIVKGEMKQQGIGDLAVSFLQQRLPEYDHKNSVVNLKRLFYTMKKSRNVCTIGLIKNRERESYLYFSVPALIRPGLSIVIKKSRMRVFGNPENISLKSWIKNRKLKLGIVGKRSYTVELDSILRGYREEKHIVIRDGLDLSRGFLRMLSMEHIDYLIEYPSQVLFISKELKQVDQFQTIPLEEAPKYTVSHVVCSKNSFGKRVIQKVDAILKRELSSTNYRSFIERWVEPRRIHEFRENYRHFVSNKIGK